MTCLQNKNQSKQNIETGTNLILWFQAKIEEEDQQQKTLEKPDVGSDSRVRTSSSVTYVVHAVNEDTYETVPPAPVHKYPLTVGGEDKDPIARQRRDKVREVSQPSGLHIQHKL